MRIKHQQEVEAMLDLEKQTQKLSEFDKQQPAPS